MRCVVCASGVVFVLRDCCYVSYVRPAFVRAAFVRPAFVVALCLC